MNLVELLKSTNVEDLNLPVSITLKLQELKLNDIQKIYSSVQVFKLFKKHSLKGISEDEMQILEQKFSELFSRNGLVAGKNPPVHIGIGAASPSTISQKAPAAQSKQPVRQSRQIDEAPQPSPLPLTDWEKKFSPQLRKVELVGEIPITDQELDQISTYFGLLYTSRTESIALYSIEKNYPVTFLVFMVGYGIRGYSGGDFWPAFEKALGHSINHSEMGKLFEKLLKRFNKPLFRELRESSLRYVSPILAHGGIPVYCLKDFFSNIVLNCAIRPQLQALEGDELVEEILKHPSYTQNTDKPVLHFLEHGGRTAENLLDRSRKMLLAWQNNQTLLSAEVAGLPVHLTEYFAEWVRENANVSLDQKPRNRLKRPQLSIDPWGLGAFIFLPSQPISALNISDLKWQVDAGQYHEEIKARTQRKGDQVETREITLRLNEVPENIKVLFSQGDDTYDWDINGFSPDQCILAFDPTTGQIHNRIPAKEIWLLYPRDLSISMPDGEAYLLEVLPDLPGNWSMFRLECWDLTKSIRFNLIQNDKVLREIHTHRQEKVLQPTLQGGENIPTDLEENPIPIYAGKPPSLRIPLSQSDDMQAELSRWHIKVESVGIAAPEIAFEAVLSDLPNTCCTVSDYVAEIDLGTPKLLTMRPAGAYQIAIKGPLGRDSNLSMKIVPEFKVTGLKELYIPDLGKGPETISFSIQTSLLDGIDSLNGAEQIKVETQKSGIHHISVPAEVNSVGLLLRRETLNHQFVSMPLYFRINRLRWRLVGDNGLVENWLQKHNTLSVQELLQETSPLLIVDLPGNERGELSLRLNLLDIQGNIIQQLKPSDRSTKRVNRFWRFDLSRIKHLMDTNDSPIFRVDLVGVITASEENEFTLPALVFTREFQITGFTSEVHTTTDQYHILIKWHENKQLRSRALILWSIFRPWQAPIFENIPDAVCGEYEFFISRKDHAEGLYRMQMVVVDPWSNSSPPLLPPVSGFPGCYDIKISSSFEYLKKIENKTPAEVDYQTTQFSLWIETALIRQHLGEPELSHSDLKACCQNLLPATSREILTLMEIIAHTVSSDLLEELGNQIMRTEVLNRINADWKSGEISIQEFISILKLLPHSKYWTVESCEILAQVEDPKIRFRALAQLVIKDVGKAVFWIIKLIQQSKISLEDAVELLFEEKLFAIEHLNKINGDPIAAQLLVLLKRYNLYSGLPVVRTGSWVLTNAGWGMIEGILDPDTRISVDNFLEGSGKYNLTVALHIYESHDLTGEKALIDMVHKEITFPLAHQVFICQHCREFATAKAEILRTHLLAVHGNALPYPGNHVNSIPLTDIQFNINPQQKNREL